MFVWGGDELEIERPCARVIKSIFFRRTKTSVYVIDFSVVSSFSGAALGMAPCRFLVIESGFKGFHAS
jgi:hypothetical protein